jgi:hypothetical protein
VWAQALSKDEQNCVNQINKNFAKVAKAQGKVISACIRAGSEVPPGARTIEPCMIADDGGKVERAEQKTRTKERKKCTDRLEEPPHFGFAGAEVANREAIEKELALIHAIFGSDLDDPDPNKGIQWSFFNRNTTTCQLDVAKTAQKCLDAKLKVFNSCKKSALGDKGGPAVESTQQLQDTCLGSGIDPMPDLKRRIVKACKKQLGNTISKKCVIPDGVDLARAFPVLGFDSNDPNSLLAYIDDRIECQVCLALNAVDGLNRDCDLFDDGVANFTCGLGPSPECEVLNATECLLPFPSTHFMVEADTATGFRVNLPQAGLPSVRGPTLLPDPYNELDGFSPMVQILMHFPQGVDPELSNASRLLEAGCCGQPAGPPWIDTRTYTGRSLDANSPTVLLNADTGERVLHFIEPDAHAVDPNTGVADLARQSTIMRPGLSLIPGHRYIVAMRNLKDPNGNDVVAELAFQILRDQASTTSPAIGDRRQYFEDNIFSPLAAAGIVREDLVLAFDFIVQSEHQLTHQMLSMREQGFDYLADVEADPNALGFSVDPDSIVEHDCNAPGQVVWRDVAGTYQSPLFLDGDLSGFSVQFMNVDANDTPVQNGFTNPNFDISIPCSVLLDPNDPNTPVSRPIVLGHGLFGTGASMTLGIPAAVGQVMDWDYIAGATDYRGLSSADLLWVVAQIIGLDSSHLNDFAGLPDRLRQGMLNTLLLAKMMKLGLFNRDPAFQTPSGQGVFPGPSEEMYYYGISLGGVMGTFFSAVTPDVERFGVDVPAINFSCLLQRSTQFIQFEAIIAGIGVTDPMQTLLAYGLIHELWVSAEPAGYARHITSDPLPGSGNPSRILMTPAWLDKQVSNQCQEIAARTLGLTNLSDGSLVQDLQGIPDAPGPLDSGLVMYDTGSFDVLDPNHQGTDANGRFLIPALANLIPSPVCDPHGARPGIPAGILQLVNFLQPGGQVENFCNGLCDAGDATETAGGNPPCDPLQ